LGITVFRIGSLARERVRDACGLDWNGFSEALRTTPAGNGGAMMLPWFEPEITPRVPRPGPSTLDLDGAPPERRVRGLIEAQMMATRLHSEWMGVSPTSIYATGGAAANREILQVMADVFAAPVRRSESTDSAALGAALRAWQAASRLPWHEVTAGFTTAAATPVTPVADHVTTYRALQGRYIELEREALARW
jgi:xylulokinase